MKQQIFEIDLKQPVIISQQAATVGAHQSLDYIAGSALLGLAAAKLYAELSPADAFKVFHSGYVQFLDALPILNDEIAYPVPLNLHAFKAEKYTEDQQILAKHVFDVSAIDLQGKQPVQLRGFYVTASGKKVTPSKQQTLKTAIDQKQNRAAESQLFGYEALNAGQKFRFALQADDSISEEIWQKLIKRFNGTAHLGRSRSAQFGRVEIQAVKACYVQQSALNSNQLTLLLLSDLYLHHSVENTSEPKPKKLGENTLMPTPENLGLPQGTKLLTDKSFMRSRRYSTYNAYRKHYDKERQVITRGSVLRYQLPDSFTDYKQLEQKLSQGLGLYTENGLGQVWINPPLLSDTHPQWTHIVETKEINKKLVEAPRSILIETLQRRSAKVQFGTEPRRIAERIFNELCEKVKFARQYHAMSKGVAFDLGKIPSRTQFGRFKKLANQNRNDSKNLWRELTNPINGMLNISSEQEETNRQSGKSYLRGGWQLKFGLEPKDTLGDYLKSALDIHKNEAYFPLVIAELAVFGLTDQWEKYSLGLEQQGAEA